MKVKQLRLNKINRGNHILLEVNILKIIESWEDNLILIDAERIKVFDVYGNVVHESRLIMIEDDLISKTFTFIIHDYTLRIVVAGDLAVQIINAKSQLEPFTISSIMNDGFAVHFELRTI